MGLIGKSGVIEIGDRVFGIIHENGSTNSGFLVGDEGVIVIEALETRKLAEMVKSEVRKVTEKPIRSIICTHFHGDHSLGNQYYMPVPYAADGFPANWAKVIGSIEELDIDLIVPGHGRLGDKSMAIMERELLAYIANTARGYFDSGVSVEKVSFGMINNGFDSNLHGDMLDIAIDRLYKEFSGVI